VSPGFTDAALAPDPRPERPRPARRTGEHLRPVDRRAPRRAPAVPILVGTGIVISGLFALAVMHALLIGGQIRLDDMQREVASETEEIRRLRLSVAELEAPERVLDAARSRLGMVQPAEVGYLAPAGVDTGDEERARVAPAEAPTVEPELEAPSMDEGPAEDDASDDTSGEDTAGEDTTEDLTTQDHVSDSPIEEEAPDAPVAGGGDE
jgi:cell division protein FtsL